MQLNSIGLRRILYKLWNQTKGDGKIPIHRSKTSIKNKETTTKNPPSPLNSSTTIKFFSFARVNPKKMEEAKNFFSKQDPPFKPLKENVNRIIQNELLLMENSNTKNKNRGDVIRTGNLALTDFSHLYPKPANNHIEIREKIYNEQQDYSNEIHHHSNPNLDAGFDISDLNDQDSDDFDDAISNNSIENDDFYFSFTTTTNEAAYTSNLSTTRNNSLLLPVIRDEQLLTTHINDNSYFSETSTTTTVTLPNYSIPFNIPFSNDSSLSLSQSTPLIGENIDSSEIPISDFLTIVTTTSIPTTITTINDEIETSSSDLFTGL